MTHLHANETWLTIEGDAGDFQTVLHIRTGLHLDRHHPEYREESILDLILAAQRHLLENTHIDRFALTHDQPTLARSS